MTNDNTLPMKKSSSFRNFFRKPAVRSIASSLISILAGILVGFLVLLCINPAEAPSAFINMLKFPFINQTSIASIFYNCAPILMTGLAVAFCFKAGSFNIGGSGQFLAGATCAFVPAIMFHAPWYLCLLCAVVGGGIVGSIPGLLKAYFNVNEVLSAIMINWIMQFSFYMICQSNTSIFVENGLTSKVSNVSPESILPTWGMESVSSNFTIGFFLACIIALIISFLIEKTTFGFEIKACGLNKDAAKYAGINEKKNIILAFTIAGILAGIGGAIYILMPASANSGLDVKYTAVPGQGFDGISVALLANNNPLGCIFSAFFIQYLTYSGTGLGSGFTHKVPSLIVGIIVYFASFVALINILLEKGIIKKPKKRTLKKKEVSVKTEEVK
ncbi:MAG: ABC transporter permease [Bacilli bacterium]